jgi:hypothetical protein
MSPDPVIEHLDVFKDALLCNGSCFIATIVYQFCLQCTEEGLCRSIVEAVPVSAHALGNVISGKKPREPLARILASPVGMKYGAFLCEEGKLDEAIKYSERRYQVMINEKKRACVFLKGESF